MNTVSATVETTPAAPADPNATPLFAAWLKQNADDVARLAADHQIVRD